MTAAAIKFEVCNRWTGNVQFTAEIECAENTSLPVKIGLAVKWALKDGANLTGANLYGANLTRANLYGARNVSDRVIDGGLRSDGYRFFLTRTEPGEFRIKAGCRNFTVSEAKKHWDAMRPKGESLGDETRLIIKHMLAIAKLREWTPLAEKPAAVAA